MVSSKFLEEYNVSEPEIQREASEIMGEMADAASLAAVYQESIKDFAVGSILKGKVVAIYGDDVIVDVGYKSEGTISLDEFDAPRDVKPEDEIEVLLESVEDESGLIVLSKRKADRIRGWERIFEQYKEGDTVTGRVSRKIKGGLLVDIGVPVFMPASQVDIRRPSDVGDYIGREIECKILKIDQGRRNIVVSRRRLLEDERSEAKGKLMEEIEVGQKRTGVVKNVTDFGAFVDLGGIDGLLHVTDMSWSRISHPSDMVHPEQTIEVLILNVDRAKEKIALGLKQLKQSPWENVEEKYPVG
ncbi:MAG: S1 RNA-binding domain-containing protein, partial [Planctomycetia bacterium]|nr:S1 RNA-binding domain-containing protein [Planctomycetia bacterium]